MPRRLRVAFAAQQFLTLPCAPGAFTRTGRNATLSYFPNQVIEDTWTRLDTGGYASGDSRAGPQITQGWTTPALDTLRGYVFLSQGYPALGANFGNFFFNTSLGYWERTNTISNDWHRNMGAITENYDMTFDPDNNCFWRGAGGPFGGNNLIPAGQNQAGPWLGDGKYNVATDEWSTPWPIHDTAWVPLPGDSGYFGNGPGYVAGRHCLDGFDSVMRWHGGYLYQWGSTSTGGAQNLKRLDLTTGTITTLAAYPNVPPSDGDTRSGHYLRGGVDMRTNQLYQFANEMAYYTYSLTAGGTAWTAVTTTGTRPQVAPSNSYPTSTRTDWGIIACIDEAANCAVAWCGRNVIASDTGIDYRQTWIMDLATREWRLGPGVSLGHTVPPANSGAVQTKLMYDPVGRRTLLTIGLNGITQVWALNIAPIGGIITSWPLPTITSGTYGVGYYGFPYTSNGASKHTNMAYCPLDNRLYVTGGDTAYSATDGTWSMSMDDGTWRLDVGQPSYPTLAAPHAYQDGALFVWMPSRQKLLFFGGAVFGYEATGSDIYNYSSGYWMYDPVAGTWEQVAAFWSNPTLSNVVSGTGNEFGGVYDEVTDTVYVLGDPSAGASARRWNIGTNTVDSNVSYTVPTLAGFSGCYFMRTRQCQLGRYIYTTGYYTNGINQAPANNRPALFRWGIDDHTFTRLAAPPDFTVNVKDIELTLFASNGKIVHPRRYGPDGEMPEGIHVYNPASDTWTTDTKTPAYGNFIFNSGVEIPDGRIAMGGGVFGPQQTNLWFYEAT